MFKHYTTVALISFLVLLSNMVLGQCSLSSDQCQDHPTLNDSTNRTQEIRSQIWSLLRKGNLSPEEKQELFSLRDQLLEQRGLSTREGGQVREPAKSRYRDECLKCDTCAKKKSQGKKCGKDRKHGKKCGFKHGWEKCMECSKNLCKDYCKNMCKGLTKEACLKKCAEMKKGGCRDLCAGLSKEECLKKCSEMKKACMDKCAGISKSECCKKCSEKGKGLRKDDCAEPCADCLGKTSGKAVCH